MAILRGGQCRRGANGFVYTLHNIHRRQMRSSKKLLKMFHQILRKYRWFIDIFFTAKNMDIFEHQLCLLALIVCLQRFILCLIFGLTREARHHITIGLQCF